jgi:hypothetical protein
MNTLSNESIIAAINAMSIKLPTNVSKVMLETEATSRVREVKNILVQGQLDRTNVDVAIYDGEKMDAVADKYGIDSKDDEKKYLVFPLTSGNHVLMLDDRIGVWEIDEALFTLECEKKAARGYDDSRNNGLSLSGRLL